MTTRDRLVLPTHLARTLYAAARGAGDAEICGFLSGDADHRRHHPIANVSSRARDRFEMGPAEQIAFFKQLRVTGAPLAAIYHSHPRGEAEPSAHDIAGHSYPDTPALIVAPAARTGATLRAWTIRDGRCREIEITAPATFL